MLMAKQVVFFAVLLLFISCNNNGKQHVAVVKDNVHTCMAVPTRFQPNDSTLSTINAGSSSYADMVLIPGGTFDMGGDNEQASPDEYPKHKVRLAAFYIDVTEGY